MSKFEFDAIMETVEPTLQASSELSMALLGIKRIRKVAVPVWNLFHHCFALWLFNLPNEIDRGQSVDFDVF
jgi:hypothetical protein